MASTLYSSGYFNTILRASIAFELFHVCTLGMVALWLPQEQHAHYALIICLATLLGKCIDAGAGAGASRWVKIAPQHGGLRSLLRIILIQNSYLIMLTAPLFSFYALNYYKANLVDCILICLIGILIATTSVMRHLLYALQRHQVIMRAEVSIQLTVALACGIGYIASLPHQLALIVIFVANGVTAGIALYQCQQHISANQPHTATLAATHKQVATMRLQLFSTKLGKELLSTYFLTPLFIYTHGHTHGFIFFIATSLITSLNTIIKMSVGYATSGRFAQAHPRDYTSLLHRSNRHLLALVGTSTTCIIAAYTTARVSTLAELAASTSSIFYCALIILSDTLFLNYEQYFLVSGNYNRYQAVRLAEWGNIAASALLIGPHAGLSLTTSIILAIKITSLLILRARAHTLTKLAMPAPHNSPHVSHTHGVSTPISHPQALELSSPKARGRAGRAESWAVAAGANRGCTESSISLKSAPQSHEP
jgi:hypothetical protein